MVFQAFKKFRSTEKSQKIWSTDYETFDQLKKHNFDQVNFGQTTPVKRKKKLSKYEEKKSAQEVINFKIT